MIQHHRNDYYQRPHEYDEEDYEDYEEEASEYEEEEQEAPKPTKEEQDFLKIREQLKANIRQKQNKQSSGRDRLSQTHSKREVVANDSFGSFFGPSKPSIAPRVIEESKSIREMKHIVTSYSNSSAEKRRDPTISSGSKSTGNHQNHQRPKIVKEVKNKAQTLKDMRDYSFLLSDDADLPSPVKEPPKPSNTSASSDGRLAQASAKSKLPVGKPIRPVPANHEQRKPPMNNQYVQNKVRQGKETIIPKPRPSSDVPRKISNDVRNTHGTAPGRPIGNVPSKNKVPNRSTVMNKPPRNISNEPIMKKNLPLPRTPVQNHYSEPRKQNYYPEQRRQNHHSEQRRLPPGTDRAKTTIKQPISSSRTEPSKPSVSRGVHNDRVHNDRVHNDRPIKKPVKRKPVEHDDDPGDYRSAIRAMFRYNPNKYAGMDEDDSDMEVGFDVIQKEERISSKIAKREDEEQLRLIEEEEDRERRMRMKKKQKLR